MRKDKLIKNELLNACVPEKSFEEFCRENNLSTEQMPQKRSVSTWWYKAVMPAVSAVAVILAIVLPITLSNSPSHGGSTASPLMYSSEVTYEQVLSDKDVILMNMDYMFDEYTTFRKMFVDGKPVDESSHVGYTVTTNVYGAEIDGNPYTYGFTLTTAKSNALGVLDKTVYNGCDITVRYGDVDYNYKVDIGFIASMHVYYKIGKYEYFLTVTPFGTAAIADDEYMQMFLRLAFDRVDGAERIQLD